MKYNYTNEKIQQESRAEINEKIIFIISNNLKEEETGISKEDIANAFTGVGGLHGLNFSDYSNYNAYQRDKAEIENGQFFTSYPLVEYIYDVLKLSKNDMIADLCSGHGSFINGCPNETNFYGCELDPKSFMVSKYLYPDAKIKNCDIRSYEPNILFDAVLGNPPFNLTFYKDSRSYRSEVYYCLKAAELLKPGGFLAIIVPKSFCADEFTNGGVIDTLNEHYNYVVQIPLRSNAFQHLGVDNYDTKVMILQKKSEYLKENPFCIELSEVTDAEYLHTNYIKPLYQEKENIKQKLFYETMNARDDSGAKFSEKVLKLLYDIKVNPKTNQYYGECQEYVSKYRTQKKPEHIKWDEWESIRIKSKDVIDKLKKTLRLQHPVKDQSDRLIYDKYSMRYNHESVPVYEMVTQDYFPFENEKGYAKLVEKKSMNHKKQMQSFKEMEEDRYIKAWLSLFKVYEPGGSLIRLNEMQMHDTNLFLQKNYNFVQWEQGSGKTITGLAQAAYRMAHNNIRNVIILSTAIAIRNNWVGMMECNRKKYVLIEKVEDIRSIKRGQFVLITLNKLVELERFMKEFIRKGSQKYYLIFDESDNISNPYSKSTKAVLNCFRRLKYKTLMTGTSTRNNLTEIYPQAELLFNNSYNMLSMCDTIMGKNSEGKVEQIKNPNYMMPYPVYRKGYKLFTESHIPEKITVFGVSQFTQDVYNKDVLMNWVDTFIITRTFDEVTGHKDLYKIVNDFCEMSPEEEVIYDIAIKEFYKLEYLFNKTGNSRKDAMLKVLNQLIAMLKICAAPQTISTYKGDSSNKFRKIISMIEEWKDERVAIGVRHVSIAQRYFMELTQKFPERKIFFITGDKVTLKQRRQMVDEIKKYPNAILICTQQSLSSSMNIDFINKVIIPELHWNNSAMSQFYFRFIRYTSTEKKEVHFVTYESSIETNLLKMILVKDKLNLLMKDQDLDDDELYSKYGLDTMMLQNLMYKEKTDDGYEIRWGKQKIC